MSQTIHSPHSDGLQEAGAVLSPAPSDDSGAEVDWQAWVDSWDAQQAGYVVDREARMAFMFYVLERLDAAPGTLLDLACGTGTIAERALRRFPGADVLALDVDPFLTELGRRTLGDQVTWIDADLRDEGWDAELPNANLDAVCSATALHWLSSPDVERLADVLTAKLRPGGVFLNYDSMPLSPDENPRLSTLATKLRHEHADEQHTRGARDWQSWWQLARSEPAFEQLLTRREQIFGQRTPGPPAPRDEMVRALRSRGFAEVDTLAQSADRHLLVAIR